MNIILNLLINSKDFHNIKRLLSIKTIDSITLKCVNMIVFCSKLKITVYVVIIYQHNNSDHINNTWEAYL